MARAAYRVLVRGRVQGVGFRFFAREQAEALGIVGYVRNLPNGRVEALIEGDEPLLEDLIARLGKGPPGARVEHVDIERAHPSGKHDGFRIVFW